MKTFPPKVMGALQRISLNDVAIWSFSLQQGQASARVTIGRGYIVKKDRREGNEEQNSRKEKGRGHTPNIVADESEEC